MSELRNPLESIWNEKYRPTTLDEIILPERLKRAFRSYIEEKSIPNLMFLSPSPGTGKTTVAEILSRGLNATMLKINGKVCGGIETVRNKIDSFAKNCTIDNSLKIVFIDEADGLTPEAQKALQGLIEEYVERVRFIFTANDEFIFTDPLKSRFQKVYFETEEEEYEDMVGGFAEKVFDILDSDGIKYEEQIVFNIIKGSFPDHREAWEILNFIYKSRGEITKSFMMSKKAITSVVNAMNTKDLKQVRDIIKTTNNLNYNMIYTKLMERVDELDYKMTNAVFTLADWNYKNKFVADKMLNFLGMCADMIQNDDQ